MLGQVGIGLALGRRNARTIAERPHLRVTLAAHGPLDDDVSPRVLLHGQVGHDRVGNNPGCQDDGLRLDRFVRQMDLPRFDRPHFGVSPDVGPGPAAQDPDSVVGQPGIHLGHDALAALEQDAPYLLATHVSVERRDRVHERGQLTEQLHADQPAADDHERQQCTLSLGVRFLVRALEAFDHVVPQEQGVGERLERERVLRAGDHVLVGQRPERQDQLIVGQLDGSTGRGHADRPALQVDALHASLAEAGGSQERPHGERAVPQVEGARAHLEEQRRDQEEVVPAHQDDLDIRPPLAELLQVAGGVDPAEATAKDHDASLPSLGAPPVDARS